MLKGLDPLLVPRLLAGLAEMGHGDIVAIVDRNFPAHSHGGTVVELPQADAAAAISAVLSLLPVDQHGEAPIVCMLTDEGEDSPATAPLRALWNSIEARVIPDVGVDRRTVFYERARHAFVTIRTGEAQPYACYLITKGTL